MNGEQAASREQEADREQTADREQAAERQPERGGAPVRAAGGVVWRPAAEEVEIVLVHRPRHEDWSLPKGKLDDGETWLAAAVREIEEETGFAVEVGEPLGDVTYLVDHHGSPATKIVHYWALRVTGGAFVPNDEVDELRWVPLSAASGLLSYDLDREVVDRFRGAHGRRGLG